MKFFTQVLLVVALAAVVAHAAPQIPLLGGVSHALEGAAAAGGALQGAAAAGGELGGTIGVGPFAVGAKVGVQGSAAAQGAVQGAAQGAVLGQAANAFPLGLGR